MSKLYNFFGGRISKDKTRFNISIITGEKDKRTFDTISIKLDSSNLNINDKDGYATVKIKLLKDANTKSEEDIDEEVSDDDIPF